MRFRKINLLKFLGKVFRKMRLRTRVAFVLIAIMLPLAIFRIIYNVVAAPPVANTRWAFDDAQGTNVQDASTNDNDGTITGATWSEKDRCLDENCLYYDGADDRVVRAAGDDADFDFAAADSFTISLWFRTPPKSAGTSVLAVKLNSADNDGGYIIQEESDGDITCGLEDNDADTAIDDTISSTAATYDDNKWHYVACVKSGTTSLTLYIDGVQITQVTSLASTLTLENDETFTMGADNAGTTNEFTGFIDEFRLFRQALTANEIKVDYNFGAAARFEEMPSDSLTEGLSGYWKMDEAADATRADSSGNANTLTESAADTIGAPGGKFGPAGDFESTQTEYVSAADSASLSITGSLTLAAWIRPEAIASATYNIIAKWDGANESYRLASIADGTNHEIRLELESNGNYQQTTAANLVAATFYNVVGVYDQATQTARIYINGVETASTTTGTIPASITDDPGVFTLGAEDTTGGATGYYDGYIDEARVYNRALSPSEVAGLYNWAAGPAMHFKLDENTGATSVFDTSGSGNVGAIQGTLGWGAGKYGGALNLDGGNSEGVFITAPSANALFSATDSYTWMAWVKLTTCKALDPDGSKIIEMGNGATALELICNPANLPEVNFWQGTRYTVTGTTNIEDKNWHHIAFTRIGANVNLYVDGVLEGSITNYVGSDFNSGHAYRFGYSGDGIGRELVGLIDDVRIYNYGRSPQQIIDDMNAGHPTGGSPIGTEVIQWGFDEQSSTTAYDGTGHENGVVDSNLSWKAQASCRVNGCLQWDAADEEVTILTANEADIDFNVAEPFSGSAWVYVTTMPGTNEQDAIIAKWDDTGNLANYKLYVKNDGGDTTGNFEVQIYDESASQAITASQDADQVAVNTWYHVSFTFNGGTAGAAGDLKLYIDGRFTAQNSANASFLGLEDKASDFTVGEYDPGDTVATNTAFTGYIDEVKMYSSALSADEVKIDYNMGANINFGTGQNEASGITDGAGTDPFLYWNFDENTGTSTVYDKGVGGSIHNGDMFNFTSGSWIPGKYGSALSFNGTDTRANTVDHADFNPATITIEAWVYLDSLPSTEGRLLFVSRKQNSVSPYTSYDLYIDNSDDKMRVQVANQAGTAAIASGATALSTKTWYHLVGTWDGTTIRTYLNGQPDGAGQALSGTSTLDSDSNFYVGTADGGCCWMEGNVDEVKLYNYVRTQAQISYDYNRGAPIGWWKLDENVSGNGQTIYDSTLIKNGATDDGANNTGMSCTVNGRFNTGCDFDGTDDYIEVGDTTRADTWAISFWAKPDDTTESMLQLNATDSVAVSSGAISIGGFGTETVYIDGKPSTTFPDANWHNVVVVSSAAMDSDNVELGRINTTYYNGVLDEVRIYNYQLSASQARILFNEGAGARFGPTEGAP